MSFKISQLKSNSILIQDQKDKVSVSFEMPEPYKGFVKFNNKSLKVSLDLPPEQLLSRFKDALPSYSLFMLPTSFFFDTAYADNREDVAFGEKGASLYFVGLLAYVISNAGACIEDLEAAAAVCENLPNNPADISSEAESQLNLILAETPNTYSCSGMAFRDKSVIPGRTNLFREQEAIASCIVDWAAGLDDSQTAAASELSFLNRANSVVAAQRSANGDGAVR